MLNEVKYYLQTDVLIQAFSLTVVSFLAGRVKIGTSRVAGFKFWRYVVFQLYSVQWQ